MSLDEKDLEACKEYRCRICKRRLSTVEELRLHMQRAHDAKRYSCRDCDYQTQRKTDLERHQSAKHAGKPKSRSPKKRTVTVETVREKTSFHHSPKSPPVVRRKATSYAPSLSELLPPNLTSPLTPSLVTVTPRSPSPLSLAAQSVPPVEVFPQPSCSSGPDPRLFRGDSSLSTSTPMERALRELRTASRDLPSEKTFCEWKVIRLAEAKADFVTISETAIHPDGTMYRSVREERRT